MSIETSSLSEAQFEQILSLREDHFHDLKSKRISPSKLSRAVAAFANATGGELYIGVEEVARGRRKEREWSGFANEEGANAHIQVFEELFPLGQYFGYTFLSRKGAEGLILQVSVNKCPDVKRATDGKIYLRRSAQNLPITSDDAIRRLELDKGIISFESQTAQVPLDFITNSLVILEFVLEVIPSAEPATWLKKQLLIRDELPTVAAILLFGDEPQAALPKRSGIKIFRYETQDREGQRENLSFDPLTIEGHLYQQIQDAVQKTAELVEGIQSLGPSGLESVKYPTETLHEIITNAVLHLDYSVASDIQIRIFDNRIEVESPGILPGHVTVSNILSEQFARNGSIVRLINKFPNPPNKDVGEGLNTAFNAMKKLRLKEPVISETPNSVLVDIRHERLASPEEAVMEYLRSHDEITNRITRELTGISSENKVKEAFYRLRDRGLLERVPGKRGSASAWRKTDPKKRS